MTILGYSNSAANNVMMSKNGEMEIQLSDGVEKHCGKKRNCSIRAISPFSAMFLKAVCC